MHKILLSIGTNTNACFNLKRAIDALFTYFPDIRFTKITESEPCGEKYIGMFLNVLAYLETDMDKDEVSLRFKNIEKNMGRQPSHKKEGIIIIDIDLIQWDNEILKPEDFKRPYMHELLQQMQYIAKN